MSRLHARIAEALGETMPSAAEEEAGPQPADARYDDALADVRTRDREQFPLVFEENANYGFRRNMLGLRPWGLAVSLVSLAVSIALLVFSSGSFGERAARWCLPAAVALLLAAFWWGAVTPAWVRVPAEAYAERLIESIDILRMSRRA